MENKYSVTITTRSGDRVLTEVVYPEQDYADVVATQVIIGTALMRAGIARADAVGTPVPDQVRDMLP